MEVNAQLSALYRSPFAVAVRPAPRDIVEDEKLALALVELDVAVVSFPTIPAKSKLIKTTGAAVTVMFPAA